MKMILRNQGLLGLAVLSASLGLALPQQPARAQQYPVKDIHIVSAFPAGSSADVLVRYFAERLRPIAGRTVLVENKPGADGNIATQYAAKAKPDGYTILFNAGNMLASNHYLIRKNPVDAGKQLQIAATINRQAFMLVVDAAKPWKTMGELTAYLKQKTGSSSYGAIANSGVVMCALYKELAGVAATEVGYKIGQDMLKDMLKDTAGSTVDFACTDPVFALSQQKEGRLRILAVASQERLQAAPDIPSMSEQGYPMDLVNWFSAMVPAATPRPIIDRINGWFAKIHAMPETAKFLTNFGGDAWMATPEEGQARLLKDIKDWEEYVRVARLKPQD